MDPTLQQLLSALFAQSQQIAALQQELARLQSQAPSGETGGTK